MPAHDILRTYDAVAPAFHKARLGATGEVPILDRALRLTRGHRCLDLGCGTGAPIAEYLMSRSLAVTGVDGAAAMITHFRQTVPRARAVEADMRRLRLPHRFDLILAWHSFFHLTARDQIRALGVIRAHARPGTLVLLSTGHRAGVAIGTACGTPVFHESLSPRAYRCWFRRYGMRVLLYRPRDRHHMGPTYWFLRVTR